MEEHIKKYSKLQKNSSFVDEARVGLMDGYRNEPIQVNTGNAYAANNEGQNYNFQPYYAQTQDDGSKRTNIWVIACMTISVYILLAYIILVYK